MLNGALMLLDGKIFVLLKRNKTSQALIGKKIYLLGRNIYSLKLEFWKIKNIQNLKIKNEELKNSKDFIKWKRLIILPKTLKILQIEKTGFKS